MNEQVMESSLIRLRIRSRKLPDEEFQLTGEVHIHGIIDGKVMDLGLDEVGFCLR
ncbi:hypothetical protein V8E51_010848 [Hyaloscypha variabilis]